MPSDIDLLSRCVEFTLSHATEVEHEVHKQLQTSAGTPLVSALRMLRLQRAILAIGMFSLFEALLQSGMGWEQKPFDRLHKYLTDCGSHQLAEKLNDHRLAINVLKHGKGPSYQQLLAKSPRLEFKVKPIGEPFFFEGDVSEVDILVEVDNTFVRRCAALIQEASAVIRAKEQIWI